MPVPRRFDRRPPERDQTRTNERIRVPEVRLVGEDGKQIGVVKTSEALAYAQERDLDLVEVAPDARPPVCRVLDYSKYKYEQAQKLKQARKHQQQITIREIKFRPKIAQNDYDTKKGHVRRFLLGKDRVKVTIMFRGREVTHPERGSALLEKLAEELSAIAAVEQRPIQDGRNMTMMLAPSKAVLSGEIGSNGEARPEAAPEAEAGAESKAAAASDNAAEPKGAGQPKADVEPKADAEPKAAAESKAAAKPKRAEEPKGAAEPKAAAEQEAAAEQKVDAEPKADAEQKAAAEPKAAAERKSAAPKAAAARKTDAAAESSGDAEPEAAAESPGDAESSEDDESPAGTESARADATA